jgi:hypothetical protein
MAVDNFLGHAKDKTVIFVMGKEGVGRYRTKNAERERVNPRVNKAALGNLRD